MAGQVFARKISFGSQSDVGAKTREILMTVLHTLKKRSPDVTIAFKSALDKLAEDGDIDPYNTVFSFDSSQYTPFSPTIDRLQKKIKFYLTYSIS